MSVPGGFTDFTGLSINGAPLSPISPIGGLRGLGPNGKVWYVCSLGGPGGSGDGTRPDSPLLTVGGANGALARMVGRTNNGDVVVCLPGHVESVSSADYFSHTGTASGFSIYGYGTGTLRPTFNWTVATSTWLVDTANIEISGLRLNLAGADAAGTLTVTTPITVSAAGFKAVGNFVNWGQSSDNGCGSTLGAIAFVGASQCEIVGNKFISLDTAGTLPVSCLSINGCDFFTLVGNQICGGTTATTVGSVHFVTTASLNVLISGNRIENLKASSTKALTTAIDGVTGSIEYNRFRVQSGIVATTIATTPFLCSYFQNFTADTDTQNGALDVGNGTST